MKNSRELLRVAKIYPKLRLGTKKEGGGVITTGPHTVKMIEDKVVKGIDRETGKVIDVVRYILEEDGEQKQYTVPVKARDTGDLHYLVQRLAEVKEGETIVLEMKKRGIKNYVEVSSVDGTPIEPADDHVDDITDEDVEEKFEELSDD